MTPEIYILLFAIGFLAGLRSMTPPAAVAWAAHLGWIHLHNTPLSFLESRIALVLLTMAAIAELIADQLPSAPARTAPVGFTARIVTSGFCGAALALSAGQSVTISAFVAIVGAVAGTVAGYHARVGLVRALKVPDIAVALPEDLIAISGALFVISHFH